MTHRKAEIRWMTSSSAARGTTSSMEIQADQIDQCIQKMNQASLEFYTPVGEMDINHTLSKMENHLVIVSTAAEKQKAS